MRLDEFPSEILFHILQYLTPDEVARAQLLSHRLLELARDPNLWRTRCYEESYAERRRRRQQEFDVSNQSYMTLLRAMLEATNHLQDQNPAAGTQKELSAAERAKKLAKEKQRIIANWDPTYSKEKIDWYQEYIQRHGEIVVNWFEGSCAGTQNSYRKDLDEVTGAGIAYGHDGTVAMKAIGAMDDGSVCIWEMAEEGTRGNLLARSPPGLLTGWKGNGPHDMERTKALMTETGAIECVSIDEHLGKAYFGVLDSVVEIDLTTLKILSSEKYPFPVTAISQARSPTPITVGTNHTLHLYDPRDRLGKTSIRQPVLIGGPMVFSNLSQSHGSHATLAQPGPLSILHREDPSIWVAGRFTSLLNYDRRFFPRLHGHIHSGARIACLRSVGHPFIPRGTRLSGGSSLANLKSASGITLMVAGEYKGKGSLELYGLSPGDYNNEIEGQSFLNRQTASSSKLLSVSAHGANMAFSDSDGEIKWVERDGFSPIRTWNINAGEPAHGHRNWQRSVLDRFEEPAAPEDIVQLLLPTRPRSTTVPSPTVGENDLLVWTGAGRLGLLGFGRAKWDSERFHDALERREDHDRRREERDFDSEMGKALRAHANELNFLRELGL